MKNLKKSIWLKPAVLLVCAAVCTVVFSLSVSGQIRRPATGPWAHLGKGLVEKKGKRYAIKAGKILTITRGVINGGVILVKDGKIEDVGPRDRMKIPEGYETIDASKHWVMPGYIDCHCHTLGATVYGWGNDLNDTVHQLNPGLSALDTLHPENDLILNARAAGVTAVVFIPGSGSNQGGWGVVAKNAGKTTEEMVMRYPGVLKVAQAGNPERRGDLGRTRMGMNWLIRDLLLRGKKYHEAWKAYEEGRSSEKPEVRHDLENFRGLYEGLYPALIHTQVAQVWQSTMRTFHDEVKVPGFYTSHASMDAFVNAPEAALRKINVDVGPRGYYLDPNTGRYLGLASLWWEGGVRNLTINTDAPIIPQNELWFQATMASRLGLDEEEAIKAQTIRAARSMGLEHRMGSIEKGKDADLQIRTGSPLDVTAYVWKLMIDGVVVYDIDKEKRRF